MLGNQTSITALRFCDPCKSGSPIPPELTEDLGAVPASLRYIQWDVCGDAQTYLIERRGTKTVAIPMERPLFAREKVDWTSESILDHVGAD